MPSHKAHRWLTRLFLKDRHDEVHKALDAPYVLLRHKHRKLFHDPITGPILGGLASAQKGKNPMRGALAGLIHIIQDWMTSGLMRSLPKDLRKVLRVLRGLSRLKF